VLAKDAELSRHADRKKVVSTMNKHLPKLVNLLLALWGVAAFLSGAVHLVAPTFMSSGTSWQYAYGWQREIAFFDIMLSVYICLQLRTASQVQLEMLALCLAGLSACLGANHFISAMYGDWGYVHVAGSVANALAVFLGAAILMMRKKEKNANF
jgi:hypothetical protein